MSKVDGQLRIAPRWAAPLALVFAVGLTTSSVVLWRVAAGSLAIERQRHSVASRRVVEFCIALKERVAALAVDAKRLPRDARSNANNEVYAAQWESERVSADFQWCVPPEATARQDAPWLDVFPRAGDLAVWAEWHLAALTASEAVNWSAAAWFAPTPRQHEGGRR